MGFLIAPPQGVVLLILKTLVLSIVQRTLKSASGGLT